MYVPFCLPESGSGWCGAWFVSAEDFPTEPDAQQHGIKVSFKSLKQIPKIYEEGRPMSSL